MINDQKDISKELRTFGVNVEYVEDGLGVEKGVEVRMEHFFADTSKMGLSLHIDGGSWIQA